MTFQLDTTGVVTLPAIEGGSPAPVAWGNLTPFTQGYVEALFAAMEQTPDGRPVMHTGIAHQFVRFSDLAPETLARIIADCADYQMRRGLDAAEDVAEFWRKRNPRGFGAAFPPLTVQLGDDGKVRFE